MFWKLDHIRYCRRPLRSAAGSAISEAHTVASLRRQKPERRTFQLALAQLYVVLAGWAIDCRARQYPADVRDVKVPTYPWQREVYWSEDSQALADRLGE